MDGLVFYEDAVGLIAERRWGNARRCGSGHVGQRIVLGINAGNAHLEFIRITRVVQCFFQGNQT